MRPSPPLLHPPRSPCEARLLGVAGDVAGMVDWMEYVIKPSSYVSGLCYSLLRLEPWDRCGYGCIYCYARWYRGPHGVPRLKPWWPRLAERLLRASSRLEPRPWWRFSTLSEPLQELRGGLPHPAVLRVLGVAARLEVPLVLNTRSSSVARPEVLGALLGLAEKRLLVVQVSLSPRGAGQLLEPGAPPVEERLEALETLAAHGVPVVARVQPVAPGFEEEALRLAEEALDRGALGLVSEPLRETIKGLRVFYKVTGVEPTVPLGEWEPYQLAEEPGREPLLHPPRWWRWRLHASMRILASRRGGFYAPCKDWWLYEAAWPSWAPGRGDCCLLSAARGPGAWPRLLLRPTLHEAAYYALVLGRGWDWEGFLGYCLDRLAPLGYVCGPLLEELPGWLRRPLRLHEKRLARLVSDAARRARLLGLEDLGEAAG